MSGAGFAGALTDGGDEYRAADAAGYTRRPADWCHNGHPFRPGTTIDNDPPSDDWCDVCGEARRPAPGGVPVEALRELADEIDACRDAPEPELSDWARYWRNWGLTIAGGLVRALLDSATTDGGESDE